MDEIPVSPSESCRQHYGRWREEVSRDLEHDVNKAEAQKFLGQTQAQYDQQANWGDDSAIDFAPTKQRATAFLSALVAQIKKRPDMYAVKPDSSSASIGKEMDQKSGILLSSGQARKDFASAQSEVGSVGVIFVDIDKFKDLNTRHTEPRIDRTVLLDVQNLLADIVKTRGYAYREGGDEFVILLPNHDAEETVYFAEKVRRAFEQKTFAVENEKERITISAGVAVWPDHGDAYQNVLEAASAAKGRAKSKRNCVVMGGR